MRRNIARPVKKIGKNRRASAKKKFATRNFVCSLKKQKIWQNYFCVFLLKSQKQKKQITHGKAIFYFLENAHRKSRCPENGQCNGNGKIKFWAKGNATATQNFFFRQ